VPEEPLLYWLVSGRIPYDDDDTLYTTPGRCTKTQADEDYRTFMISSALEYDDEGTLRSVQLDNITADQPLTDGVIVTAFASSDSPIAVDRYLL
jgi:phage I-like protein